MAILARFRKMGGFAALVQLLESCDLKKREDLLKNIELEDDHWAALAREKILTAKVVYSWPSPVITEIITLMAPKIIAISLKNQSPENVQRIYLECLTKAQSEAIDQIKMASGSTPEEITAAENLIVGKVRELVQKKVLNLGRVAPEYILSDPVAKQNLQPTIVLAHGDSSERFRISQFLKRTQYSLIETDGSLAAMDILNSTRDKNIVAVFSSTDLKSQDGFELLMNIRENQKFAKLPVVILSKSFDKQHVVTAQQLGANKILPEPLSLEIMIKTVSEVTRKAA